MKFTAPLSVVLGDQNAEAVRKNVDQRIREVQSAVVLSANVITDVTLPNGDEVVIPHRLGRRFQFFTVSPTRGAAATGRIGEVRGQHSGGQPIDPSQYICLQAVGYGATITVDVMVW